MTNKEDELGKELRENNERIVHFLLELRAQRDDLIYLFQKQEEERKKLEMEMERLTYKLCLINKSMAQRVKAKQNYDTTIEEIEEQYRKLKQNSVDLMMAVVKDCDQLDSLLNKKTSTDDTMASREVEVGPEELSSDENSTQSNKRTSIGVDNDEDCSCLPNKDGKCIREKKISKMIQASPLEAEVPTKLEKDQDDPASSKYSQEKGAQTIVNGEPKHEEDADSLKDKKNHLTQVANMYKQTSLRRSQ